MPSVNINPETFSRLAKVALETDSTPDEVAEAVLCEHLPSEALTDEEWRREWDELLSEIRAGVPKHLTVDEIEADVAATVAKVRAERSARGR